MRISAWHMIVLLEKWEWLIILIGWYSLYEFQSYFNPFLYFHNINFYVRDYEKTCLMKLTYVYWTQCSDLTKEPAYH
jgi:hypothetical protein